MTGLSTKSRLNSWVELALPEFQVTVPRGEVRQASLGARVATDWLASFGTRLANASGFLPIYRMSDGEFLFVCGLRPYPASFAFRYPRMTLRSWARVLLRYKTAQFKSGTAQNGFERYTPDEWENAKEGYGLRVKRFAQEGILAVNFVSHLHFPSQYIGPMCDWMDANQIGLSDENYFPFYFVYALLLGPRAARFYEGRRILVVTSDEDGTKATGIERSLLALGAKSMVFRRISPSKSMWDRVDLSGVGSVDLVLIGAGVGALNILEQVRPLATTSIDAGFALDCLWRPQQFVGLRAFTQPDEGSPLLRLAP